MTAVTLPVQVKIDGSTQVFVFTQAKASLKKAQVISLANCDCRKKVQACDNPLDVCINLDKEAERMISKRRGRQVPLEGAMAASGYHMTQGWSIFPKRRKVKENPSLFAAVVLAVAIHLLV